MSRNSNTIKKCDTSDEKIGRLDTAYERISDLNDISIEITQTENQIKKKKKFRVLTGAQPK